MVPEREIPRHTAPDLIAVLIEQPNYLAVGVEIAVKRAVLTRESTAGSHCVEGQRVVISGDRGSLAPDGTMRLFGRDSLVINTGGEKVFVEEVEEVLRGHPAVTDALVVGRPSERYLSPAGGRERTRCRAASRSG